ncbi:MAG: helix-turn-helix transcriptional regulator [Oscillatoriales cyanobacterium SM2_1_8]|nr:helix-turn-helix transcriptional regulator [Oscillatoriales cyanobacterium SM2_1_8]
MKTVLHQIRYCPYAGNLQRVYLKSKAWELLVMILDRAVSPPMPVTLKAGDTERIYQARQILMDCLECPPSLLDLARQVGLNDCTLKKGFREVFGTTAFGFLHDYRLEKARQLLLEQQGSVTEISRRIGFSNRSYFASAFRKKYGLSPKELLKSPKIPPSVRKIPAGSPSLSP